MAKRSAAEISENEAINQEAIPQELQNIKVITITRALGPEIPQPNLVETQTTSTTEVLEPEILQKGENHEKKRLTKKRRQT